jgi:soluble lytic murein transglycosylase
MTATLLALAVAFADAADAAPRKGPFKDVPLPRPRPAAAPMKPAPQKVAAGEAAPRPVAPPLSISAAAVAALPAEPPAARSSQPAAPMAFAPTAATPASDIAAVKQAIDFARKDRLGEATRVAESVGDPLARKLIEWVILRADDATLDYRRYAAFIAANPGWPGVAMFRRKAEASLWQDRADPGAVRGFFAGSRPISAKGRLALARALLAGGDSVGAQQQVREVWRFEALSRELENQVLKEFGALLTAGDYKIRMDVRLYAEDSDAGLRAAQHLGPTEMAIARARAAVIAKAGNAGKLLDAVPEAGRHDTGYIFSRVQWLRRNDKIEEAARWLLAAPKDAVAQRNTDEWWIERRLVARKLLDQGDARTAYRIVREAAIPVKSNYKVDQPFTAGWIALRALDDPTTAMAHFAAIRQVSEHPLALARAAYWQGRAAEALGRREEARAHYQQAAHYPTAYYGQLARAKLGAGDIVLRHAPEPSPSLARLEVVRAAELLYAIDERDLVVSLVADLADRADAETLAALAALAQRHQDARATLLIGRGALTRGLPFDVYAYPTVGLPRYTAIGPAVEPQVAYSIARQESGFNPKIVSSANAIGLMQVTPVAGKYVAKKFGFTYDHKRLVNDPAYNMQLGAAELGDLIETYRGSYILAFAAYNAGRTSVKNWIERYGDPRDPKVDPVDWVERIPFTETRNYVQRVLENLQVYRVRFGVTPKLMIEADLRRGALAN